MPETRKAPGELIAALDIGSSKTVCFIGRIGEDEGHIEVIGIGHQESRGVRQGAIVDLDAAETAIRQTVHAAENMAADIMRGYPLREVVVSAPWIHLRGRHTGIEIGISGEAVTDGDIRRALARAQHQAGGGGEPRELVHTIAAGYRLDGREGVREPRGMHGERLEMDVHLVSGDVSALRNIAGCISRSHLDIAALCAAPYASGLACQVEDEMDLGCTVIDMGAGLTSFAVFYGGNLIYADAFPIGGHNVTSDIARMLTTSLADAERMKILYGSALPAYGDESDLIDVPLIGEEAEHGTNHIPRARLVSYIQPRLEEIFNEVRARLQDSGLGGYAGRRVVLTGGASQLPGTRELAQSVLERQVRLGRPIRLDGLADAVSGPAFSSVAGLLTYFSERGREMPADIMSEAEPRNLWERTVRWLRENW